MAWIDFFTRVASGNRTDPYENSLIGKPGNAHSEYMWFAK